MDDLNETVVKTKNETDRHCPDCDGVMDFDPKTGGLSCPYCGHTEQIPVEEEAPKKAEELDFFEAENTENCDWGVEKKTVICKACAAEIIYDALQTSGVCPFCGSNQVMEASTEKTIAPGGVVPFQITDKQASENFHGWIKRKWFCPKLAKQSAKPKQFKGIYLPYWTFDTNTYSTYTAQYGKDHTTKDKDGNIQTETSWHNTSGRYQEFIDDQIVLASKNHDQRILDGLEPFHTEDNKAYKPEYVAGFISERYSIGLKDAWEVAKNKIINRLSSHISDKVREEHNADHVRDVRVNAEFQNITYKYLMLPIWISNFKYKDKVYQFMVNGQTGKVSGKTPLSIPKIILTVIVGIAAAVGIYYIKRHL
ncbi:MAG: hypothetical protein Q4F05_08955 [bacterium]|nr:hypothetical protein [bacterium]